jgi:DNA-binding response OmpR family regulator
MPNSGSLSGFRFLIVEDEVLQAACLADMLVALGGTVSETAYGYDQARRSVDEVVFDCAILDINLGGVLSFPIIDRLCERSIPFVICTAYGAATDVHPGAWAAPRLDKPLQLPELREAVLEALDAPFDT